MEITTDENGTIVLKSFYNSILLDHGNPETIAICMRDTGFEFKYFRKWYSAQGGVIKEMAEQP